MGNGCTSENHATWGECPAVELKIDDKTNRISKHLQKFFRLTSEVQCSEIWKNYSLFAIAGRLSVVFESVIHLHQVLDELRWLEYGHIIA